mgnify:CR=1 FL=1
MELLTPQLIIIILATGACAGFLAGLLGIGGGVILVPLFLWLFKHAGFTPDIVVHTAFGTSLAVILPTAVRSTLGHRSRGNVDWRMVFYLACGGIVGSLIGSSAAAVISGDILKTCFGLMQIIISLKMIFHKNRLTTAESHQTAGHSGLILVGLVGGFFSAFFGIGGGVVAVPLMLMLLRLPIHLAVGNSSALIIVSSFAAVCCYIWYGLQHAAAMPFSLGYVNLLVAAIVAPLSILFAGIGVKFASKTSQGRLTKIFAVLLILVGLKILFNS